VDFVLILKRNFSDFTKNTKSLMTLKTPASGKSVLKYYITDKLK